MQASVSCIRGTAVPTRSSPRPTVQRRQVRVLAAKTADGPRVAIVGASGAVGQEFLRYAEMEEPLAAAACWGSCCIPRSTQCPL